MDETIKDQLTASFRAYLDAATEEGDADETGTHVSAPAEPSPDLFTLFAELAALKSEVKLESRQVKSALDEMRGLVEAQRAAGERLENERARRHDLERSADRQAQKELLLELLELRDRLEAGQHQAERFRPGWLGRRKTKTFLASMAEGMAMNLRRLEESLARRGVRALAVVGRPFDPRAMHAAELTHDPALPEGQVTVELRRGFLLQDQLLRPAEVAVNRPNTQAEHRQPLLNS